MLLSLSYSSVPKRPVSYLYTKSLPLDLSCVCMITIHIHAWLGPRSFAYASTLASYLFMDHCFARQTSGAHLDLERSVHGTTRLFHFHQHACKMSPKAKMPRIHDYKGCHLAASQGWLVRPCSWVVGDAFAHPT